MIKTWRNWWVKAKDVKTVTALKYKPMEQPKKINLKKSVRGIKYIAVN
jgi:hypothetical protein